MNRPTRLTVPFIVLALLTWLALVVFTASRHEFWRDEVRALTLVRAAESPLDLYRLIEYDGHPVLWYLLLYVGTAIVDSKAVLPVASVLVAFVAVALFMFRAPFPIWLRTLFVFSALPLYEYAVMARNYGISMLLMFVAAVAFPTRLTHPVRFGLVLALLANTNVHSAMLVGVIGLVWAWDAFRDPARVRSRAALTGGFALAVAGIALSALFAMPRENTILTSVRSSLTVGEVVRAGIDAVLAPGESFAAILPEALPAVAGTLVIYLALFGLLRRGELFLAGVAAIVGFGVFFRVAYPGYYRHQGMLLLFLVFLYWAYRQGREATVAPAAGEAPAPRPAWTMLHRVGAYAGLGLLFLSNVAESRHVVTADIRGDKSSSRAFGEFLRASDRYGDAIIVAEPDFMMEALPYYVDNPIYLPREGRFGRTVAWTSESRSRLTLGEVLAAGRKVAAEHPDQPVLFVFALNLLKDESGERHGMYNKVFTWTTEEFAALKRATREVAVFDQAYEDERYRVLELVEDPR